MPIARLFFLALRGILSSCVNAVEEKRFPQRDHNISKNKKKKIFLVFWFIAKSKIGSYEHR
jgi:hypothetical protein